MKKFNLSEALEGKPVVRGDGEAVTQLHLFDSEKDEYVLCGIIDGSVHCWTKEGKNEYTHKIHKPIDPTGNLYMAEEEKTIWINVWKNFKDGSLSASVHTRKDKCDMEIDELLSHTLIKTIEITE
jgi:hypothetical protein